MVSPDEAFQVLLEVVRVLEELDVSYVVGGSLASSLHGIPRSTQDADLVAALRTDHIQPFISRIEVAFYVSPERVETAVRRRIASPEDTILQKLLWYRKGGGVSERPWSDVLGVIKVQGRSLDLSYLKEWAERSGVEDLLARAFTDSGLSL